MARKAKILRSCAGIGFAAYQGQIIEETARNAERLDSLVRHDGAVWIGEESKKKLDKSGESGENTLVHDGTSLGSGDPPVTDKPKGGRVLRRSHNAGQPTPGGIPGTVQEHDAELAKDGDAGEKL